jgi:hypothetical protein
MKAQVQATVSIYDLSTLHSRLRQDQAPTRDYDYISTRTHFIDLTSRRKYFQLLINLRSMILKGSVEYRKNMGCATHGDHGSRKLEYASFCNPTFNETRSQSTNLEAGLRLVDLYSLEYTQQRTRSGIRVVPARGRYSVIQ